MSSLEGLPDSVLAQIPLLPPPPGVVSNFVNPPNNGTSFIVFGAVIVPVMLAFFSIRLYTKFCIIRQRSWDDLTCSLAALGAVLHYTVTTLSVTKGKFGRHCWDISIYDTSRPWYGITTYMVNWSATLILPFAKLTFYIFYINLFRPFKWIRILCYLGIVVTTTAYLGFLVAQLALTTPHPGESWLEMNEDPRPLKIPKYLSIPITALSFGTDLYIFALPILGIAKLDLTRHRKIGVSFVFMTGFAACIASFLSLYYKIRLNNSPDLCWDSFRVTTCILAEINVGVIASCIPSLSKYVRHSFPNFSPIDSLLSLQKLFLTKRNGSDLPNSTLEYHKRHFDKLDDGDSGNYLRQGPSTSNVRDIELGNPITTKTHIAAGRHIGMEPLDGIEVERGWIQTFEDQTSS